MSTFTPRTVRCEACDASFAVPLAEAMHITRLPEVRAAILDRSFQVFVCPSCGRSTHVESDTVYTDFVRWQYVAVVAGDPDAGAVPTHAAVFEDTFLRGPSQAQALGARMKTRLVFGHEALREKLLLWDAGIDDRAVEAAKQARQQQDGLAPSAELWRVSTVLDGGHLLIARLRTRPPHRGARTATLLGHTTITAAEIAAQADDTPERWVVDAHDEPATR